MSDVYLFPDCEGCYLMTDDSVLEEAMDNLREAARLVRATQTVMHTGA